VNVFFSPHNDDETLFGSFIIQELQPIVAVVFRSVKQGLLFPEVTAEVRNEETRRALTELMGSIAGRQRFVNLGIPDDDPQRGELAVVQICGRLVEFLNSLECDYCLGGRANMLPYCPTCRLPYDPSRPIPAVNRLESLIYPAELLPGGNYQHNLVAEACSRLRWMNGRFTTENWPLSAENFPAGRIIEYLTYNAAGKATSDGYPGFHRRDPDPAAIMRKFWALYRYRTQRMIANTRPHFLRSQAEYYLERFPA